LEEIVRVVAADDADHNEEAAKPETTPSSTPRDSAAAHEEEIERKGGPNSSAEFVQEAELAAIESSPPAGSIAGKPGEPRGKERVLIVEDSTTIASVVKYFLELEGFEVLLAKDGKSGLKSAKRHQPNVIVTDYNMPGMDGMSMVRALRAEAATRGIAVLMLTSEDSVEKEAEALEAGVDDYILKPVEPRRLAARVRSVLARSHRRHTAGVQ
jgi:PleD family two-component response regulator